MNRVVHFEIPASDPERSAEFYGKLFGWTFEKWQPAPEVPAYWMVDTGKDGVGINGGMMKRNDPAQPMTNVIDVESVDDTCARIEAAGGAIVVPKMPIPGIGWLAYFKDPDGIIFGLMQEDSSAG